MIAYLVCWALWPLVGLQAQDAQLRYLGGSGCQGCHSTPPPAYDRDLSLLNEAQNFQIDHPLDRHALAYQALEGDLGKKMGARLGIDLTVPHQAKACLSCHVGWKPGEAEPPAGFDVLGVSCEACHGPSSAWDVPHREKNIWRKLTAAEKAARGFVNVRDVRERAKQCLSCHMGNVGEGKIVTHEMYAAGHPPLGAFELESHVDRMPRHWRRLNEKGNFDHREKWIQATYGDSVPELPRAQGVVVGGVMTLRQSVLMLVEQARIAADKPTAWPELSQFDCQACHHELNSRRKDLEGDWKIGSAGRPQLPMWAAALAPAAIDQLAESEGGGMEVEFKEAWTAFRRDAQSQPFGSPASMLKSGETLLDVLDRLAAKLVAQPSNGTTTLRLLTHLTNASAKTAVDYRSALQLTAGVKIAWSELETKSPIFGEIEAGETASKRRTRHARDAQTFEQWQREILPEGGKRVDEVFLRAKWPEKLAIRQRATSDAMYHESIGASLAAAADFDAAWFRAALVEMGKEIPRSRPVK